MDVAKKRQDRWMIQRLEQAEIQRGVTRSSVIQRLKYNEVKKFCFVFILFF